MNIVIKGKNLQENTALENYAFKKANKFFHYQPNIIKVEIELRSEVSHKDKNQDFLADIHVKIPKHTFQVSDSEADMYKAIDKAVDRMIEVLRREKEKNKSKRRKLKLSFRDLGIGAALRLATKKIFRQG